MSRWIVLIVLVIVLSGAATFVTLNVSTSEMGPTGLAVNERKGPQPKVEIAGQPVFDFGTMSQFRKASHVWEIRNVGEADLEIWLDHSTCSCTIAKLSAPEGASDEEKPHVIVKPKQTTPIELEWDTRNSQPDYSKGAWIGTNDPSRPTFSLSVKGLVYPPVQVYPPDLITLNGISNEEVTKVTRAVYSMDMGNMKVVKISFGRPEIFSAKQTPLTPLDRSQLHVPAGGHRIDIEIKPGLAVGRFMETMVIETDHPLQKETKISISGYASGPISIVPDRLIMRGVSSATGGTHSLNVVVRGGKPVNFTIAQKPSDDIEVAIAPYTGPNQGGRYRLTVTVPPGTPAGNLVKDIVLTTDHPRASEIKIPVSIIITNQPSA